VSTKIATAIAAMAIVSTAMRPMPLDSPSLPSSAGIETRRWDPGAPLFGAVELGPVLRARADAGAVLFALGDAGDVLFELAAAGRAEATAAGAGFSFSVSRGGTEAAFSEASFAGGSDSL
jgi:hypothetical protein